MINIKLKEINWNNFWDIINLDVLDTQRNFLPSNAVFMAQAYVNIKLHYNDACFGIYNNDELVGFTKIVFVEKMERIYNFNKDSYYIDALMIDKKFQGKGLGKAALNKILEFIKTEPWGKIHSIRTSCYDGNAVIKKLLKNLGFLETDTFILNKKNLRLYILE